MVEVVRVAGSVPRESGTRMLVTVDATIDTIGGGHLEWKAIAEARDLLASGSREPRTRQFPLGPALGQCCGGAVTLRVTRLDAATLAAWPSTPPRFHLQLHGAGHVGRAVARALAALDVAVDWIDGRDAAFPERFFGDEFFERESAASPSGWPSHIRKLAVDSVEAEVRVAPVGAFYLVMTHEHDLDLRITEAVLRRGDFGFLGLIGSATKRQRFTHRLQQRGFDEALVARMTCPIGLPGIGGKEPAVIAASVVAQMLALSSEERDVQSTSGG
jgi:xanthine dehydrogenase accessory factor